MISPVNSAYAITERYAIADIVDKVSPAVVLIVVENRGVVGSGSGFLMTDNGLVVTNHHVITQAQNLKIVFTDGTVVDDVEIIGSDERSDIAVLKLQEIPYLHGTPKVDLGDSDQTRVGEWVIALGSPFGGRLGPEVTATAGIIGARRTIETAGTILGEFLQTDAAINVGNSGGPLVNLDGEVIGINTAIIPYAQGIGFAIPVNRAQKIIDSILTYGKVLRPWFGAELGLSANRCGALVLKIDVRSPAFICGLRVGDIIVEINRQIIESPHDVHRVIESMEIGEQAFIVVLRYDQRVNLVCEIQEQP